MKKTYEAKQHLQHATFTFRKNFPPKSQAPPAPQEILGENVRLC